MRSWRCLALVAMMATVAPLAMAQRGCDMAPAQATSQKSPGDNFYRLIVNGEVERYAPGQRYVVTLVGSRTHDVVQQFTRFKLSLDPLDPSSPRSPARQGQWQLFADTLSRFDQECTNAVVENDDLPKTEVQVMWKAPPAGSGCVLIKAMVFENESRWFAEDGQLTRRVCEDTSLQVPDCCACDDAKYKLVFEGLWSPETHPKDFPTQALWLTHFSDVIGATHLKNFSFWGEGQIATDGFRSLAEWGSVGLLERELQQQGSALRSIVKAQGLWHPRLNSNTTAAFTVDRRRHLLSLASMFGPSPDWVVGVSGLELCLKNCSWVESQVVDLYPYDAGTDNGISYMSPNSETVPREKMYRITEMYPEDPRAPFYAPGGRMAPMARLYISREALVSRSCDEELLLSQITEEAENTQAVDRPECAVTEWSAWSACSVTCGKGLRMRTREYRSPAGARASSCDRQLVSKEMCVAAQAECEGDRAEVSPSAELSVSAVDSAVCETSEWSDWGECSATCGVGISTRTRHFLNQMGLKKCPLVSIEETRKCMEPPCEGGQDASETADPECPTTAWSAWSPCSATCGRGVRFRTRLLLVPAAQQLHCAARVELMQQRPCTEKDDCTLDMQTAKRVCMEPPDAGPCRGVYQRWSFVAMKGMCIPFSYGGCRGNRNNFLTQEDCQATCSVIFGGGSGPVPAPNGQPGAPTVSSNYPGFSFNSIVPLPPGAYNGNQLSLPVALSAGAESPGGVNPADCRVSPWSDWSRCSVSCGVGYQQRTRTILSEAGPGGAPCPARLTRRRRCSRTC